jgi:DNA-binding CsgD family transcriptional regulator
MERSGQFEAKDLEPEWSGYTFRVLAHACEAAALTEREARAVNLYARGHSMRSVGELLGMAHPKVNAWRHLKRAVHKLATELRIARESERRVELSLILHCIRNSFGADHGPPQQATCYGQYYKEVPRGGAVDAYDLMTRQERAEDEVWAYLDRLAETKVWVREKNAA